MVEEAKVECRVKSFAPRDSVEGHTILAFEGETGEQAAESGGKKTSMGKFVVVLPTARGGMARCALKGHRQDAGGTLAARDWPPVYESMGRCKPIAECSG